MKNFQDSITGLEKLGRYIQLCSRDWIVAFLGEVS